MGFLYVWCGGRWNLFKLVRAGFGRRGRGGIAGKRLVVYGDTVWQYGILISKPSRLHFVTAKDARRAGSTHSTSLSYIYTHLLYFVVFEDSSEVLFYWNTTIFCSSGQYYLY